MKGCWWRMKAWRWVERSYNFEGTAKGEKAKTGMVR